MPIYDYECNHCKETIEDISAKVDEKVKCPDCKKLMTRLMPCTHGINMNGGPYGYFDETLDKHIPTMKARRDEMEKQGVTPKGDSPKLNSNAWV